MSFNLLKDKEPGLIESIALNDSGLLFWPAGTVIHSVGCSLLESDDASSTQLIPPLAARFNPL
jgi:hypothetical protein